MNGARSYYNLFKETQQIGKLYIVLSCHARGRTFMVFVLPEGELAVRNGDCNPPLNKDAIQVYGVVSGQTGWSEQYGWLYQYVNLYDCELTEDLSF